MTEQQPSPATQSPGYAAAGATGNRIVGVKAYGWEWANDYNMSMPQAADHLVAQGMDWVLAQNLIDPLPASAVDQTPPEDGYEDRAWTQTLQERGLKVFQTTATFFDVAEYERHPELRPVDQTGAQAPEFGWYRGINPTNEQYLERKIEKICRAVDVTQPDGLFASFFRFPSFWELWLPDSPGFAGTKRQDIREYGFDEISVERFAHDMSVDVGSGPLTERVNVILNEFRTEWTAWKCRWILQVATRLRTALEEVKPGIELMLNGFGLGQPDFGNIVEESLGQDLTMLREVFEHYELMFYFQIQKRDPYAWIPERIAEVRTQLADGGLVPTLLADLQGGPEYLEEIYAPGKRRQEISPQEWLGALQGVERSGADGVLVYSWRDLLADEARGGERVQRLREYRDGSLPTR